MGMSQKNIKVQRQVFGYCLVGLIGFLLIVFSFLYLNSDLKGSINIFISRVGGVDYPQTDYAASSIGGDVRLLLICDTIGTGLLLIGVYGVRKQIKYKTRL
jgi:hypothetical protein